MANVSKISGLSPVCYLNGSPWNGQAREYYIAASNTTAFAVGDPVDLSGGGDTNGVPGIVLATAGNNSGANRIVGAVVGAGGGVYGAGLYNPANSPNTIVVPATKTAAYYALVADDPNILFAVQEGGTGTALAATEIGLNIDLASGTNNGYVSGWVLDNAVTNTSANYQMKLMQLQPLPGGTNVFGTYAKWLCKINLHRYAAGVAGV